MSLTYLAENLLETFWHVYMTRRDTGVLRILLSRDLVVRIFLCAVRWTLKYDKSPKGLDTLLGPLAEETKVGFWLMAMQLR